MGLISSHTDLRSQPKPHARGSAWVKYYCTIDNLITWTYREQNAAAALGGIILAEASGAAADYHVAHDALLVHACVLAHQNAQEIVRHGYMGHPPDWRAKLSGAACGSLAQHAYLIHWEAVAEIAATLHMAAKFHDHIVQLPSRSPMPWISDEAAAANPYCERLRVKFSGVPGGPLCWM